MNTTAIHALQQCVVTASGEPSFLAQVLTSILGFGIVFLVLKRFAFGPVLDLIDERREKIESDLRHAEELQKQAADERAQVEERLRGIENEARARMQELITEGKTIAQTLKENAQKEAEALIEKAQQNIRHETEKARAELKNEVITMTLQATEHLIKEQLNDEKHRQLVNDFLSQVERN